MTINWVFQTEDKSNYKELVSCSDPKIQFSVYPNCSICTHWQTKLPDTCEVEVQSIGLGEHEHRVTFRNQVYNLDDFNQTPIQLLEHQRKLVERFHREPPSNPFLLYWAMGSGKTIGILAAVDTFSPQQVTIVCANTILDYWSDTVKRIATQNTTYRIVGYTEFRKRCILGEFIGSDDVVIIDEAHHYRNLTDSMINDVYYMKQGRCLFLLTGTPILNSVDDFAGLCGMMDVDKVTHPQDVLTLFEDRVSYYDPSAHDLTLLQNHFPTLKRGLAKVPMTWRQTLEYVLEMKQTVTLGNVTIQSSKPNTYDVRSRLISNAPRVGTAPKLKHVVRNMLSIGRYPQVVYSHFRARGVEGVLKELNKRNHGLTVELLTGSTPSAKRRHIIQNYNDGSTDVLMITDAAKEGVDLHGTEVLHLLEPHHNLQSECQTMTRVIRYATDVGQREVLVLKYVSTFPKTCDLTMKDREKLECYFRREYLRTADYDFDLVEELWKHIQKLEKTVDEKYEWNNVVKHERIKPYLTQLQVSSFPSVLPSGEEVTCSAFDA